MADNVFLYHYPCADGFGTYHIFHHFLQRDDIRANWEFIPINYSDPVPDVAGKFVLMADFSFKPHVLDEMVKVAKKITILDHHKSALDALNNWANKIMGKTSDDLTLKVDTEFSFRGRSLQAPDGADIELVFNLHKSGVRLMWEWLYGAQPLPDMYAYVEDRDLWKWSLPNSREINASMRTYELAISTWDKLKREIETSGTTRLKLEGTAVLRSQQEIIRQAIESTQRFIRMGKYEVPVVNIPGILASEAGDIMSVGRPFSASYYDHSNGKRIWSLRSKFPYHGAVAVNQIAESYGGGGHPPAAGFTTDQNWLGD